MKGVKVVVKEMWVLRNLAIVKKPATFALKIFGRTKVDL